MKVIDRTFLALGVLLLGTLLLPVVDEAGRLAALSELPGVAPFSTLVKALYPALLGALLVVLARSGEQALGKGVAALVGFLLPVTLLDGNPIVELAYLGAWEEAPGHQVLLGLGVVLGAGGCHMVGLGASHSVGALLASVGVALMAAYHLAPLPSGAVPIIVITKELAGAWDTGGLALLTALFNLALAVLQAVVCVLALLSLRSDGRARSTAGAGIVAWAIAGLIPAIALPIVVKAGLAAGGGAEVLFLVRQLLMLSALLMGAPLAIAALGVGLSAADPPGDRFEDAAMAGDEGSLRDSGPFDDPPLQ
ncbi:MAG: hypothetical protein AMXMBFR64_44860 [Myxococcales bacterium]